MSDKHTDAQGELPELPAQLEEVRVKMRGEWEYCPAGSAHFTINDLHNYARATLARRASQVSAAAPALQSILNCYSPDDTVGDYQDKISALFRASEGQAQSSAAVNHCKYCGGMGCEACNYGQELAAQLADSTAPGAQNTLMAQATMRNISSELSAQSAEFKALGQNEHAEQLEQWGNEIKAACTSFCKALAAPTAQQSLTAGGAVPEGYALVPLVPTPEMIEKAAEYDVFDAVRSAKYAVAKALYQDMIAAAPLPQVQSEAQGWDVDDLVTDMRVTKEVASERANMRKEVLYAQADAVLGFAQAMVEVGVASEVLMTMAKGCADRIRQQPVTPSGALNSTQGEK